MAKKPSIVTAALGAVGGALLTAFLPPLVKLVFPDKEPIIEYKVLVFGSGDKNPPVAQAAVTLEIVGSLKEAHDTDPSGVATFGIDPRHKSAGGHLLVKKALFKDLDRPVVIPISSAQESVYIDSVASIATGAAAPPGGQSPPSVREAISKTFSSGPKPSGFGADFSPEYTVCSDDAPPGYVAGAAEFVLRGDRSCGAWSTCRESSRTPQRVCWAFTLQGHNEWFPPRPAYSEGILKITFTPQ
jgi:hypothetical protein